MDILKAYCKALTRNLKAENYLRGFGIYLLSS